MLKLHVAVVEDQSLSHELLKQGPIYRFEFKVLLEAIHELAYVLLVVHPVFFVLLNLVLCFTQRFIELLDVLLRVKQLTIVCELVQV